MKKRFIVIIESSTKEQDDAFLAWIDDQHLGWWHWFQNVWLLSNPSGHLTASTVRDKIDEYFPRKDTLVIELKEGEGTTWSGFGPKSEKGNMFAWLKRNWRKI